MFASHLLFSYGGCAALRVKMESGYIYSVFMWAADTVDWLNACHIDTPVVSPMGPQRHNGGGSAKALCSSFCVYMPLVANSVTCWLCPWFFCDLVELNQTLKKGLSSIEYLKSSILPSNNVYALDQRTELWFYNFYPTSKVFWWWILPLSSFIASCQFTFICFQFSYHRTAIKRLTIAVYDGSNRLAQLITQDCLHYEE